MRTISRQFHFLSYIWYELNIYSWKTCSIALFIFAAGPNQPSLQFENNEAVCRFGGRVECCIRNLNSNILPPIYAVKNLGKYFHISNLKFTMNGCRHKIVIFYFFWEQGLNILCAKFQVYGISRSNFLPKNVQKILKKYLTRYCLQNVGSFSPFEKGLTFFRWKMSTQ